MFAAYTRVGVKQNRKEYDLKINKGQSAYWKGYTVITKVSSQFLSECVRQRKVDSCQVQAQPSPPSGVLTF